MNSRAILYVEDELDDVFLMEHVLKARREGFQSAQKR